MTAIVTLVFVLMLVRVGAGAARLAGEYPRVVTWSKGEDVAWLIYRMALAGWCGWTLLA